MLIDGDRTVVAGLLVTGVFLILATLGVAGVVNLEDQAAVRGTVGGFVPGLIAFLSIVLTINQLVLSWEFGTAGEVRDRIESVREYRFEVEEMADTRPSPVFPTGFLAFVVHTIESRADALEANVGSETDPEVRSAVETFGRNVATEAGRVEDTLEQVQPGRIHALLPVLEYEDAAQLYEARRLRIRFENRLSAESRQALDSLVESLRLFDVARSQFRTTYTQRVLARLSRKLLYVGLPVLVVVLVAGLLDPSLGQVGTGPARVILVSGLFAVAFSPLAVLASYLLRIATVSERTIAVGPFVSRPRSDHGSRATDTGGHNEGPSPPARDGNQPSEE